MNIVFLNCSRYRLRLVILVVERRIHEAFCCFDDSFLHTFIACDLRDRPQLVQDSWHRLFHKIDFTFVRDFPTSHQIRQSSAAVIRDTDDQRRRLQICTVLEIASKVRLRIELFFRSPSKIHSRKCDRNRRKARNIDSLSLIVAYSFSSPTSTAMYSSMVD